MERFFENAMYASRWILAPVYFGLSLALIALTIKFFQEILHVLPNIFSIAEADLILVLLSLVDMTLVGGLLVMVMFAKNVPDNKLMWYVIIHLTFVLSAFVMGYLDKISKK